MTTSTSGTVDLDLRCSAQARAAQLRPAGTAAASAAVLLVEVPLPWPSDIADHPALADVVAEARRIGARVQGLVPSAESLASGTYRIVLHRRPPGPFTRYARMEGAAPLPELARLAAELSSRDVGDATTDDVDLLICTHGARDRCCGSLGMGLLAAVESRPGMRVHRTSHLGGHRFAPTAMVLPEGTVWAWLDADLLASILTRAGDLSAVVPHYRGLAVLDSPVAQVAEAAVFATVGWPWLDVGRDVAVVADGDDRWQARVASALGTWEATVVSDGMAPQPVCGDPPGSETKADPQLRVTDLRSVA